MSLKTFGYFFCCVDPGKRHCHLRLDLPSRNFHLPHILIKHQKISLRHFVETFFVVVLSIFTLYFFVTSGEPDCQTIHQLVSVFTGSRGRDRTYARVINSHLPYRLATRECQSNTIRRTVLGAFAADPVTCVSERHGVHRVVKPFHVFLNSSLNSERPERIRFISTIQLAVGEGFEPPHQVINSHPASQLAYPTTADLQTRTIGVSTSKNRPTAHPPNLTSNGLSCACFLIMARPGVFDAPTPGLKTSALPLS